MRLHILAGDSLVEPFQETDIEGQIIVFRECLVEGEIDADDLDQFWKKREVFLGAAYADSSYDYLSDVKTELRKLERIADSDEVFLWFEYELFCQANLWFTLWVLRNSGANLSIVYPAYEKDEDIWNGFGCLDIDDLKRSFENRREFPPEDIELGANLWKAFQKRDSGEIIRLGKTESRCFPSLTAVSNAAAEIGVRPRKVLEKIVASGKSEFGEVFGEFCKQEGVYGLGDSQVKRILDEIES